MKKLLLGAAVLTAATTFGQNASQMKASNRFESNTASTTFSKTDRQVLVEDTIRANEYAVTFLETQTAEISNSGNTIPYMAFFLQSGIPNTADGLQFPESAFQDGAGQPLVTGVDSTTAEIVNYALHYTRLTVPATVTGVTIYAAGANENQVDPGTAGSFWVKVSNYDGTSRDSVEVDLLYNAAWDEYKVALPTGVNATAGFYITVIPSTVADSMYVGGSFQKYDAFTAPQDLTDNGWVRNNSDVPVRVHGYLENAISNHGGAAPTIAEIFATGYISYWGAVTGAPSGGANGQETFQPVYDINPWVEYNLENDITINGAANSCFVDATAAVNAQGYITDALINKKEFNFLLGGVAERNNATITWGDGNTSTYDAFNDAVSHSYDAANTYNINTSLYLTKWDDMQANEDVAFTQTCDAQNVSINENNINVATYPNPAFNEFNIELNETVNGTVNVLDLTGKVVISKELNGTVANLNVADLNNGLYIYQIETANGVVATGKFSKK